MNENQKPKPIRFHTLLVCLTITSICSCYVFLAFYFLYPVTIFVIAMFVMVISLSVLPYLTGLALTDDDIKEMEVDD